MKLSKKLINSPKFIYFFLAVIILIGALLRIQGVVTNSFAFTYDVGRDMLAIQNIVQHHKIPLIGPTTGLPGVFYGPWWYYILIIPYLLAMGNPQGIALFIAVVGIGCIVISYFVGKRVGNSVLGLIFASIISVSPAMIATSTQIWNPNLAPIFVLLFFLIFGKIFSMQVKNPLWLFFPLGILLGLTIDSEIVFGSLFFLSVIVSLMIIVWRRISLRQIASLFIGLFFVFLPRIFFDFRHQFLMTRTILSALTGGVSHHDVPLLMTLMSRMQFLFNLWTDSVAGHFAILGLALLVFVAITVVLIFRNAKDLSRQFMLLNLIIVLVYLLGLTVFSHDIWPHYTVGLPVIFVFLLAMSLWFWRGAQKHLVIVIFISLLWINMQPLQIIDSWTKPLWVGDASVYRNQLSAVDYVYQQAQGKEFKYIVYTPPVYDYSYQYLFSWYGPKKYGYAPRENNAPLFFVLMEPDLQMPSRLTDWLKERQNDGKVVKDIVVRGGIRIQTRLTQ